MTDAQILRELAKQLAQIAVLPIQKEKRQLWIAHNSLQKTRPMVCMDQLPWHEINRNGEMQLLCADPFLRSIEWTIKSLIYRWNHFPCDMVVENRIDIPMSVHNFDYGIKIIEETLATDSTSDIVSHKYHDQIDSEEALEKLKPDKIWVDTDLDNMRIDICNDIFKEIIPVRLKGVEIHAGVWDRIAQMRPAQSIILDIIDRPDFTKKTVQKFVDLTMSTVDQCEKLGILDADLQYIHCSGAYNNELPAKGFNKDKPRAEDCWAFGMSQIFSTVSPQMHEEFEIDLVRPLYERFGLLYYGCCEPLENVLPYIKKISNVRKISVSPWANIEKCAEGIQRDYVFSSKPNPAFITTGSIQFESLKEQMEKVVICCKKTGTPVEFILKDVSTVSNKLEVLDEWGKYAMNLALNA